MSYLANEILLRLARFAVAAVLGLILYWLLTGPLQQPGSIELGLLCFLASTGFILLVQESPI